MTPWLRGLVLIAACAIPLSLVSGCDVNEGPAEEAGEAMDDAADAD